MKSEWKMSKYWQKRITKTKAKLMNTKARHLENTIYFCKQLEGEMGDIQYCNTIRKITKYQKYHLKNRQNTDTAFMINHAYSTPLGIISCVTLLYWLVSRTHLGKRTLSLHRLLCSVDIVLFVTFPPFCSDHVLLFLLTLLTGVVAAVKTNSTPHQWSSLPRYKLVNKHQTEPNSQQ